MTPQSHDVFGARPGSPPGGDGQPDIFEHLLAAFAAQNPGDPHALAVGAGPFIHWSRQYLSRNRPADTFVADLNVGVRFADFSTCVIAPPAGRGELARTPSVGIFGS